MDINFPSPIVLFEGTTGLNNRNDSASISDTDLVVGTNFLIDDTGLPETLFSRELLSVGSYVCTPQDPSLPYVVASLTSGYAIYFVNEDLTLTGVRDRLSPSRLSFTKYKDYVYYTNGFENGRLKEKISFSWPVGVSNSKDLRTYSGAPIGSHLDNCAGLMLISAGPTLYFSLDPHLFELHTNFLNFTSDIIMIRSIPTGVFVSTLEAVYFIELPISNSSNPRKVSASPAVEWSDIGEPILGSDLGLETLATCAAWLSPSAVCVGLPNGDVKEINKHKIKYPAIGASVASFLVNRNFIHSF